MKLDLSALSAPFDPAAVHWRVQGQPFERNGEHSAMALPYLDARDVMDRLDQVCGPENWQTEYHETPKGRLICRLSICIEGAWVTKSDGAGDTDVEGEKGAISDALKRAAVSWGIGRYLYRLHSPWVPCEVKQSNGKVYWKSWKVDPWTKIRNVPAPTAMPRPAYDPTADIDMIRGAKSGTELLQIVKALGDKDTLPAIAAAIIDRLRVLVKGAPSLPALDAFAKAFAKEWQHVKADADARRNELMQEKDAA